METLRRVSSSAVAALVKMWYDILTNLLFASLRIPASKVQTSPRSRFRIQNLATVVARLTIGAFLVVHLSVDDLRTAASRS